jgi:polysaccharide export outer membrane protein
MMTVTRKILSLVMTFVVCLSASVSMAAQVQSNVAPATASDTRPRTVTRQEIPQPATDARQLNEAEAIDRSDEAAIQTQISTVYQSFYNSYRLGPGDILGIYIDKHPEDSVEKVAVSPVGRIYFPLLGNVTVVGKTVPQLQDYFTSSVSEFIKDPRVTVALLEAQSAKIGILGDVKSPGVLVMTRPLRVLDAITMAGGITETGSSNISILRQYEDGRVQMMKIDVKKILKGKASPEENGYLRAGDTIIVHGNLFKTVGKVSSMVGITGLITFLTRGGR